MVGNNAPRIQRTATTVKEEENRCEIADKSKLVTKRNSNFETKVKISTFIMLVMLWSFDFLLWFLFELGSLTLAHLFSIYPLLYHCPSKDLILIGSNVPLKSDNGHLKKMFQPNILKILYYCSGLNLRKQKLRTYCRWTFFFFNSKTLEKIFVFQLMDISVSI